MYRYNIHTLSVCLCFSLFSLQTSLCLSTSSVFPRLTLPPRPLRRSAASFSEATVPAARRTAASPTRATAP